MPARRSKLLLFAGVALLALLATACEPTQNALTQLKSVMACIAESTYGGQCRSGPWIDQTSSASTPDGKFLYTTDTRNVLGIFMRTPKGDLIEKGCRAPATSGCKPARAMTNPVAVVATKKTVFVAAANSSSVAIFTRNPKTGALSQPSGVTGCISEDGTDGGSGHCFDAHALSQPSGLALLGNTIAVTTKGSNGLALFTRNAKTGAISQGALALGCITNDGTGGLCATGRALGSPTAVALTSGNAFVTSGTANGVAVIDRTATGLSQDAGVNGCITQTGSDGTSNTCTVGRELMGPTAALTSGDAIFVAAPASAAVSRIVRDPSTGVLTQGAVGAGCISEGGSSAACATGHGLGAPTALGLQGSTLFAGSPDTEACCFSGFEGQLAAIVIDPTTGDLSQDTGTPGCISDDGFDTCFNGNGFGNVIAVAVHGSGPIFAGSSSFSAGPGGNPGVLAVVMRDASTGTWRQGKTGTAGCISATGRSDASDPSTAGKCSKARGIAGATGVATSGNNKNVYVASLTSNAVAIFARRQSGVLKQLGGTHGCISETGAGNCAVGRALKGVIDIAVTADGKNAYAVSQTSGAVLAFARDTSNGVLTQLSGIHGCISEPAAEGCKAGRGLHTADAIAISPDDKNVYVASAGSNAVAVFRRHAGTGFLTQASLQAGCVSDAGDDGCTHGKALQIPTDIALSSDGASLYVTSRQSQAIAEFSRDTSTGLLTQNADPAGCISPTGQSDPALSGTAGECTTGAHLGNPVFLVVDGTSAVFARGDSNVIVAFARDTTTGALSEVSGTTSCVSEDGSGGTCSTGKGLTGFGALSLAPDGHGVYAASPDIASVAVLLPNTSGTIAQSTSGSPSLCYTSATEPGCDSAKALQNASATLVSPDNNWVYVTSTHNNSIAVFGRST